jgi:glycine cleavage system T protein
MLPLPMSVNWPYGQAGYALFWSSRWRRSRRPGSCTRLRRYNATLLAVNASNIAKDWQWIQPFTSNFAVTLGDASPTTALMALQGPGAEAIFASLIGDIAVTLPFHGVVETTLLGQSIIIARTGYTGEDGFEIFCANDHAVAVWQAVLAAGATPCGLGARDSLRFEPCLALYGHELGDDINPYEARLGSAVKLNKGEFVGSAALNDLKSNYTRRLVAFEVTGKGIARGGYAVHDSTGNPIGIVTTGMPSPTFGKPLGIALIAVRKLAKATRSISSCATNQSAQLSSSIRFIRAVTRSKEHSHVIQDTHQPAVFGVTRMDFDGRRYRHRRD